MGLEHRSGRVYYYRSLRVGRRVRKEYVAAGHPATLIAQLEQIEREKREYERWERRDRRERLARRAGRVRAVLDRANELAAAALLTAGWHRHNREWRKRRGSNMTTEVARAAEVQTWVPSELRRRAGALDPDVAARARKGDRSALPAVERYLDNPAAVALWGDAGRDVLARWVKMRSRGDVAVEEATLRHASALRAGLAGPSPSALDWLLAERVVLAWVSLSTLEEWQGRLMESFLSGEKGGRVETLDIFPRHIDHAHGQLMAACRALAKVRRARLPDVLALVNVTAPGAGE